MKPIAPTVYGITGEARSFDSGAQSIAPRDGSFTGGAMLRDPFYRQNWRKNAQRPCRWLAVLCVVLWMLGCLPVFAGVSEPDNIVYGTITLDNVQIKADRTDVIVEARRTINGPAIASYQMGSDPRVGNDYALRIPIESASPVFDPDASLAGDSLFIVVRDGTGVRVQASYTVANRATVQRLDFGAAVSDSDNDGLPDAWELLNFGTLNQAGNSVNLNGQTTLQNYIAGTNPNDTNSTFMVDVNVTNNMRQVSFMALRAQGTGYEGMTRYYSLEYRTNAGAGSWLGVSGYVNVPGSNQTILYQSVATNSILFFRGRTWLQGQ